MRSLRSALIVSAGAPYTVDEFNVAIADAMAALRELRRGRMVAKHREREQRLADVRAAYERGDDRLDILRQHRITHGQLAGWSNRGGWNRPIEFINTLSDEGRARYHRLRPNLPRISAIRAAREAAS